MTKDKSRMASPAGNRALTRRRALLAALLAAVAPLAARAQTAGSTGAAGTPGAPAKPHEVDGFRSAKFGMTEAEVRKAIQTDFSLKDTAIGRDTNAIERTTILSVTVKDVVPEAGDVRLFYILGYNKKRLFQIVLNWGAGVGETAANSTHVLAAAQLLLNYFLAEQFKPEGRIVNAQLSDGSTLLFSGQDEKGRTVQLQYGTVPAPLKEGEKPDSNNPPPRIPFGRLLYVEDPKNPDVFRIKPGQF